VLFILRCENKRHPRGLKSIKLCKTMRRMRSIAIFFLAVTILELSVSFNCGPRLTTNRGFLSLGEKRLGLGLGLSSESIQRERAFRLSRYPFAFQAVVDTDGEVSSSPSSSQPNKPESKIFHLWNETKNYLLKFKDIEFRKQFLEDVKYIFTSAIKNIQEGDLGQRGEELLLAQVFLVTLVLFGVPWFFSFLIKLGGLAATSGGLYFISRGVWDLRQNLSPFITPVVNNELVTTGIYSTVRHPLFTGLIALCLGVSIFSDSVDKGVLTAALAFLLDKKADKEEDLLNKLYPLTYTIYVQQTKKLVPSIY
jgi:protein-S-isoprenylcysteine O-methyltransferase Ste14